MLRNISSQSSSPSADVEWWHKKYFQNSLLWENRTIFHRGYYMILILCWKSEQEGGNTGWILQRRPRPCPCPSSCMSTGPHCFGKGRQCNKVCNQSKSTMAIYLSRLFRSSSSCPVLGTMLQERSQPSEEALDRTPNINIIKENIKRERRLKKMGLFHLK